jgi:hypothetical protein
MNYLINAIKYSIKNWMLIIPLFVLTALAALIGGIGSAMSLGTITKLMNTSNYSDPGALLALIPTILTSVVGGGVVAFITPFIYQPATYGLVNKSLETGNASLNDLGVSISSNFVKYVMYFVGQLVVSLVVGIPALLLVLLFAWITSAIGAVGAILMVLIILAIIIIAIVLSVLLSMWFAAMVIDGLDVVAAAKKSIEVVKGCFWTVLGITLLVGVAASIASGIVGVIVGWIPFIGRIIASAVPAAQAFVMVVFSMMLYRERTGRASIEQA